jgi:serine 3-dehydrogenase
MSELQNKLVFVTGASSGIGEACARRAAKGGAKLLLCARRTERLEKFANELNSEYDTDVYIFTLDVRKRDAVDKALDELPDQWKAIDVLINNAGLARGLSKLHEGSIDDWEQMIDTNIKGLLYVTRKVVPWMVKRDQGDIVNIGSLAGHEVYPNGNVYCGTKHAVDAITRGLRLDLVGTPLRVCTVDPGLVETEFSVVRFHGDGNKADNVYKGLKPLTAEDIADTIYFCITRPAHIQIAEVILMPTAQRSTVVVHKEEKVG